MIEITNLCCEVGTFALRNVSLHVGSNEYFVLLGPTGAGKSLLIKSICGLVRPRSGSIQVDGKDVTELEPRLRNLGYVPQDAGLFPHMDVEKNILFSLRVQRMSTRKALEKVRPLVDLLNLGDLMKRSPAGLSGGERQKVALARALAIQPKLLLLDEPVSALDEPTRQHVCDELRRAQKELQVATIHVSHNTEEALAVSDRAGILNDGELIQAGTMAELLRRPRNEVVARFLRAENVFSGKAEAFADGTTVLRFGGHEIRISQKCNGDVTFVTRPEVLTVSESGGGDGHSIRAELIRTVDCGAYRRLELDAGLRIVVYAAAAPVDDLTPGRTYAVTFPPDAVHILE